MTLTRYQTYSYRLGICGSCGLHTKIGETDYKCDWCRREDEDRCDYCGKEYDSGQFRDCYWKTEAPGPRFAGLCLDCKVIAGDSVPIMADPSVIYYRWAYSPTTGDTTLAHNHEGHPSEIRFHSDMAAERDENDLLFGTAHKLDNGWQVLDEDSKNVEDPHLRVSVEKAIQDYEVHSLSQSR